MKNISRYILVTILFVIVIIPSCNKDNGTTPEITRNSLTGKWVVNETQKKITYEVTISVDTSKTGVLINNFAGGGSSVNAVAYLSGTTLALATNELLSNGWIVNGSGTVSTNRIDWPYTVHDGATQTSIQAVFTKK
jgi:hypothetical protein